MRTHALHFSSLGDKSRWAALRCARHGTPSYKKTHVIHVLDGVPLPGTAPGIFRPWHKPRGRRMILVIFDPFLTIFGPFGPPFDPPGVPDRPKMRGGGPAKMLPKWV